MMKIILVEDDASIRDSFALIFDKSKYQLLSHINGQSILNNELDVPDLFILDKQISGVSGLDLCRYLKNAEKYKDVPVIMLSASPDIVMLAKSVGADDAIMKPFTIKQIRDVVAKYTDRET